MDFAPAIVGPLDAWFQAYGKSQSPQEHLHPVWTPEQVLEKGRARTHQTSYESLN